MATISNVMPRPRARRRSSRLWRDLKAHVTPLIMLLPALLLLVLFNYIPMGGVVLAFKKYNVAAGIWGSPWVGLDNFNKFFDSIYAGRIISNTIILNLLGIAVGFVVTVTFALLLNEVAHEGFKRVVQTISYFPYFVSVVVMVGIVRMLVSPELMTGLFNQLRVNLFGLEPINFLAEPEYFRPIYILMGVWQGTGFGAIIYLAALAGVDVEQYEAAIIDGANRLQLIWNVTIPALVPTMVILLLLSISGLLRSGLESILLLYNPVTYVTADVIETFVYRRGIAGDGGMRPDYGFSTAVGLFQSAVGLLLIVTTNWLAKRTTDHSLW